MTLGFPFLQNPVFLFIVQLLTNLRFDGRILRPPMLQQCSRYRSKDMKEGDSHVRCSVQKRSNILDSAMRVFGFVNGKKNSHSILLRKQRRWNCAGVTMTDTTRLHLDAYAVGPRRRNVSLDYFEWPAR
jgi:hypothetical protein